MPLWRGGHGQGQTQDAEVADDDVVDASTTPPRGPRNSPAKCNRPCGGADACHMWVCARQKRSEILSQLEEPVWSLITRMTHADDSGGGSGRGERAAGRLGGVGSDGHRLDPDHNAGGASKARARESAARS